MKKTITIITLLIALLLSLCACGGTEGTDNSQKGNVDGEINHSTRGNLSDYNVVIKGCRAAGRQPTIKERL